MWSVEYVQVPKEEASTPTETVQLEATLPAEKPEDKNINCETKHRTLHEHLAKQMSISTEFESTEEEGKYCT